MIVSSIPAAAAGKNELIFNGNSISLSASTISVNDMEMISLTSIATFVGSSSQINPKAKSIVIKASGFNFQITPGSSFAVFNGKKVDMGIESITQNNTVYIPCDIIDLAFNGLLSWDAEAKRLSSFIDQKNVPLDQEPAGKSGKSSLNVRKSGFIGKLVLVNKSNPVANTYVPENLSGVFDKNKKYLIPCKTSSVKLNKEALDAAVKMFNAASAAGIKGLIVSNGYRSYSLQNTLHTRKINAYKKIYRAKEAIEKAASIVAPPGTSEHQTGLAMDITTRKLLKTSQPLSEGFGSTPEGKWVYQNSWKYGYIVRYQADKKKITGIISEPWHIRYVGTPHSEFMYKNKLCLEEYLEYIKKNKHVRFKTSAGTEYDIFYINVPTGIETLTLTYSGTEKYGISSYGKNGFIITKKL